MVFTCYPEDGLKDEEKIRLADIMDQAFEEGFFTHRFGALSSMNYYFEITSEWARGNKEMLMMSVIFDSNPNTNVEEKIVAWFTDFAARLKNNREIFKAFYTAEDIPTKDADYQDIKKYSDNLRFWVKELYWIVIEELREKTEEEKFAILLSKSNIFKVIKKLAKGPMALDDLSKWYNTIYSDNQLLVILQDLEDEKFIFINTIGQETYVLLVKEVNVLRVPPNNIVDLQEDQPELEDLTQLSINEVRDFFENYTPTLRDSLELFKLVSDAKAYNVISQLREGPLPLDKILAMVSEKATKDLIDKLELLKKMDVIHEMNYSGEKLYILKTDIVFTASFPEYLKNLLPRKSKNYIAQALGPRRVATSDELDVELDAMEHNTNTNTGSETNKNVPPVTNPPVQTSVTPVNPTENPEPPLEMPDNNFPGETEDSTSTSPEMRKKINAQLKMLIDIDKKPNEPKPDSQ